MKIKYKKLILLLNITINHISLCSGQESLSNKSSLSNSMEVYTFAAGELTKREMTPEEIQERQDLQQQLAQYELKTKNNIQEQPKKFPEFQFDFDRNRNYYLRKDGIKILDFYHDKDPITYDYDINQIKTTGDRERILKFLEGENNNLENSLFKKFRIY